MDWLFQTSDTISYVFLRFGLALTFFFHGSQHLFGWFDGKGFKNQVSNWHDKYGIPLAVGTLGVATELFTVVAMTLGFLVRPAAFFLAVFIATAMFSSHWSNGFFLQQKHGRGSGIEYTLALLLMALALVAGGAGALSIDRLISR